MRKSIITLSKSIKAISLLIAFATASSCSTSDNDEPDLPVVPEKPQDPIVSNDSISISIGCMFNDEAESFVTARSGNGDLFGVQIMQTNGDVPEGHEKYTSYAAGVFDDLDAIKFKFVKGRTYCITFNYTPDAKDFIHRYSNGTYGYPFSCLYGLQNYTLNTPVYDPGKNNEDGYQGEILWYIGQGGYQTNESGYFQDSYTMGTTPRYLGYVNNVRIDESTSITIPLELYVSSVKLNVGNFTSGKIRLIIPAGAPNNLIKEYSAGDEINQTFWLTDQFPPEKDKLADYETKLIRIYYIADNGETYLLATKSIDCKPATTYVFNFDLAEREDGSIGIKINDKMTEEEVSLD